MQRLLTFFGYIGGSFGANVAIWPINSLLMYFLTESVAFSVAMATVVVTAPKVWDIVVDPAIGAWADRYSIGQGNRMRVLMLAAAVIPAAVALVFLLPVNAAPWMAAVAIMVLMIKSSAFMAFFISHVALADDIEHAGVARRDTMLAFRVVGQATGGLCAGALGPLLITFFGGGQPGYAGMAAVLAVVAATCLVGVALTARRYATSKTESVSSQNASLVAAVSAALHNRAAGFLIVCQFMVTLATGVVSTFLPYANKLLLGAGDSAMSYLFGSIMVAMLGGSAIAAAATRHYARPLVLMCSAALMTLAAALFYPSSNSGGIFAMAAALAFWGLGLGAYALVVFSSMMDVASAPARGAASLAGAGGVGLLLGLLISAGKIGDSLGGVVVGSMLSWSGYVSGAPVLANTLQDLRLAYAVVPLLAMMLAMLSIVPLLRNYRANNSTTLPEVPAT